jgi:hypothetical protein
MNTKCTETDCIHWMHKTDKCRVFNTIWTKGKCPAYISKDNKEAINKLNNEISGYTQVHSTKK